MILQSQRYIFGVFCELEIDYSYQPKEYDTGTPESIEIEEIWILGFYPEGCQSQAVRRGDYVSINAKCDLTEISDMDYSEVTRECLEHYKADLAEAFLEAQLAAREDF